MVNKFELLQQSLQVYLTVLKEMPILITPYVSKQFSREKVTSRIEVHSMSQIKYSFKMYVFVNEVGVKFLRMPFLVFKFHSAIHNILPYVKND